MERLLGRPNLIEEATNLATMIMDELIGSLITHEHTLQMDKDEMKTNNKKKKDLAPKILMQEEEDDFDEKMTLITRKFKGFQGKKVGSNTSRKQDEERGKEINGDLKIKKKKENSKDKT